MNSAATVFLVDDDPAVLKALARLMRLEGYDVQTYPSARAFLEAYEPRPCACLVLDVAMPDLNGMDLQKQLILSEWPLIRLSHRFRPRRSPRNPQDQALTDRRAIGRSNEIPALPRDRAAFVVQAGNKSISSHLFVSTLMG